jgi:hypothetical protein
MSHFGLVYKIIIKFFFNYQQLIWTITFLNKLIVDSYHIIYHIIDNLTPNIQNAYLNELIHFAHNHWSKFKIYVKQILIIL